MEWQHDDGNWHPLPQYPEDEADAVSLGLLERPVIVNPAPRVIVSGRLLCSRPGCAALRALDSLHCARHTS